MVITATTVYLTITLIALALAVVLAFFDGVDLDIDIETDFDTGASLQLFSPLLIMTFMSGFGVMGLILTQYTALSTIAVALWASLGALPIWGAMAWFMNKVANRTLGAITNDTVVGATGTVEFPIRPSSIGSVALYVNGEARSYSASANKVIKPGSVVRVTGFDGLSKVTVEPIKE